MTADKNRTATGGNENRGRNGQRGRRWECGARWVGQLQDNELRQLLGPLSGWLCFEAARY